MVKRWAAAALLLLAALAAQQSVSAAKTKVQAVGWSGSGMLLLYHLGVLDSLVARGVYVPGKTLVAGCSGGSYIAALSTTGVSAKKITNAYKELIKQIIADNKACNCSAAGGALGSYQKTFLNKLLPIPVNNQNSGWKKAEGRVFVQISEMPAPIGLVSEESCIAQLANSTSLLINSFPSRADLLNAMLASSYWSLVAGPNCTSTFRGKFVADGGYAVHLPCPPKYPNCLKVEAMLSGGNVPGAVGAADIYPGLSGQPFPAPLTNTTWINAALDAELLLETFDGIYDMGKADAMAWAKKNGW